MQSFTPIGVMIQKMNRIFLASTVSGVLEGGVAAVPLRSLEGFPRMNLLESNNKR